ncbi:hypothetical protein EYF80_035688 [Liparis tanakae]|uniref:Uncharacterized protein n=1 Tax=Liparis tanakae TaxID=230148 RepID=A0A4Z2GKM2_9TELE|nr:hypothetical protein EYF80_035688 [Liparis tanakae]
MRPPLALYLCSEGSGSLPSRDVNWLHWGQGLVGDHQPLVQVAAALGDRTADVRFGHSHLGNIGDTTSDGFTDTYAPNQSNVVSCTHLPECPRARHRLRAHAPICDIVFLCCE